MALMPGTDPIKSAVSDMPDVQPHAVEAEKAQTERTAAAATDRYGQTFDPLKHETNADGTPRLTANGNLARKRGRGAASYVAEPALGVTAPAVAGTHAASLLFAMGQLIGGEEWAPLADPNTGLNENAQISSAFSAYFEAQGWEDIPPGYALTIAVIGYVTPRLFMPKTKTRMQRAKEWAATKYVHFKMRRRGIDPRTNNGDDGKRQDDASEAPVTGT